MVRSESPLAHGIVFLYFVLLVLGSAFTGLWLDELHELVGTYNRSFGEMFYWAQYSPGGTPLNFVAQKLTLDLLGFSSLTVRLPAIFFGAASLWMFVRIARELTGTLWPIAATVFAFLPQVFRYGVEARPYSQGLFFALLAFWYWTRLERAVSLRYAIGFGGAVAAGLYSHVFSVFPAVGMFVWSLRNAKSRGLVSMAIAAAAVSYLPWFWLQRATQSAAQAKPFLLDWASLSPLGVVRELAGGGYFTSVPLLILAALGILVSKKWDLILPAFFALSLPIVADAVLGYFFAGRQLIFGLPFLVLLGTIGAASAPRRVSMILLASMLIASVKYDFRQATTTREDWLTPARKLASYGCVYVWGPDLYPYLRVYEPRLQQCDPANLPDEFPFVTTRYSPPSSPPSGFAAVKREKLGVAEIVTYRRDASLKTYGLSRFVFRP